MIVPKVAVWLHQQQSIQIMFESVFFNGLWTALSYTHFACSIQITWPAFPEVLYIEAKQLSMGNIIVKATIRCKENRLKILQVGLSSTGAG